MTEPRALATRPRGPVHATPALALAPAYAALDLGTNNCRLLVGTPTRQEFRVVDSFSRAVRLGEGVQETGVLNPVAMDRAVAALRVCADRLARRPIITMRAIATEACRRAANAGAFIERVEQETGLRLEVISTREEAELALESCASLLATAGRRALLFDIGGGSTELVWVRLPPRGAPELIGYVSLPVGVVSLCERFGAAAFTSAGFEAMVAEIATQLAGFEQVHRIGQEIQHGGVRLLGTSGTVTTLAGVVLALERYRRPLVDGRVLTRLAAQGAVEELCAMGRDGLVAHPCVGPDRADFVLPGCAIFTAIHRLWPAPDVTVADRGLREGLLMRMMRPMRHPPRFRPRP